MGSIPQYQRDQFASSYVGGAQKDDSNALAAGAVQEELVEPVRANEIQKLKVREDAQTDLVANSAVIQYGLDYQTGLAQLQKDYADNPSAYPQAAVEYGRKLASEQAQAIADGRVKTKYEAAAATIQRQSVPAFVSWTKEKQEFNAIIAFNEAARITAFTMGNSTTAEGYIANRPALAELDTMAVGIVDDKTRETTKQKALEASAEAYLSNRVMRDPEKVIPELKSKLYDKFPEFTAKLKAEYLSKADTRIRANRTIKKMEQDDRVSELSLEVMGGGNPNIINTLLFEREAGTIPTDKADSLLKAVVSKSRSDASAIGQEYPRAQKYLELADKYIKDNLDRARYQLLVVDVWQSGDVEPDEAAMWASLKNDVTSREGLKKNEIFKANLNAVMGFAKELYKNVPKSEATQKIAGAVKTFMSNVIDKPGADGVGGEEAVNKTIGDLQAGIDPRRKQYVIGDSVPNPNGGAPGKVTGYFANGTPAVTYNEE